MSSIVDTRHIHSRRLTQVKLPSREKKGVLTSKFLARVYDWTYGGGSRRPSPWKAPIEVRDDELGDVWRARLKSMARRKS